MSSSLRQVIKETLPEPILTILRQQRKVARAWAGDVFQNPGPISPGDFDAMKLAIDEISPRNFIEIGTGTGISAQRLCSYIRETCTECKFFTIDIFEEYTKQAKAMFPEDDNFIALCGLSVRIAETEPPASEELVGFRGPVDLLRQIVESDLGGEKIDIAFIDSRKGTAVPEFIVLRERMVTGGVIFCHDILNGGKGVELLTHLEKTGSDLSYEVLETGPEGLIKISF